MQIGRILIHITHKYMQRVQQIWAAYQLSTIHTKIFDLDASSLKILHNITMCTLVTQIKLRASHSLTPAPDPLFIFSLFIRLLPSSTDFILFSFFSLWKIYRSSKPLQFCADFRTNASFRLSFCWTEKYMFRMCSYLTARLFRV